MGRAAVHSEWRDLCRNASNWEFVEPGNEVVFREHSADG